MRYRLLHKIPIYIYIYMRQSVLRHIHFSCGISFCLIPLPIPQCIAKSSNAISSINLGLDFSPISDLLKKRRLSWFGHVGLFVREEKQCHVYGTIQLRSMQKRFLRERNHWTDRVIDGKIKSVKIWIFPWQHSKGWLWTEVDGKMCKKDICKVVDGLFK